MEQSPLLTLAGPAAWKREEPLAFYANGIRGCLLLQHNTAYPAGRDTVKSLGRCCLWVRPYQESRSIQEGQWLLRHGCMGIRSQVREPHRGTCLLFLLVAELV